MKRTLLIDADITAYSIASVCEERMNFGGQDVWVADEDKGTREVDNAISRAIKATSSQQAVLFLTEGRNFRKDVLPSYKGNRKDVRRPELLPLLREHMKAHYKVITEDGLEADDLLGIHATMPHKGERVIFSADKDLKTVPALHWCPEDGEAVRISERDADRFFYEQIITGDPTDNYAGCPGSGKTIAAELLDGDLKFSRHERVLTRGKNKGDLRVTWLKEPLQPSEDWWTSVVSVYEKAGLTEEDALIQARCARILRHGEYDFKLKKVNLWKPN